MLTHVDKDNKPTMVSVGSKTATERSATAIARVFLPESISQLFNGSDIVGKKGPVFSTAIIAGTMAVKKCWDLIPFCHPLPIEGCTFNIEFKEASQTVDIYCTVSTTHKTGVEMEALCGVNIAALTVYDMCKALSHKIEIREVKLVEKTGGKSDYKAE